MSDENEIEFMGCLLEEMKNYGVTTEEMCNAISNLPKIPFTKMDIELIKSNPSLSWFQKWKLIREVKKNMKQIESEDKDNE